jgi:hypothetical protein
MVAAGARIVNGRPLLRVPPAFLIPRERDWLSTPRSSLRRSPKEKQAVQHEPAKEPVAMPHNGTRRIPAQAFTRHFIEHVQPRLRDSISDRAIAVALGMLDFEAALDGVLRLALHLGAAGLETEEYQDLQDWVLEDLGDAVAELTP